MRSIEKVVALFLLMTVFLAGVTTGTWAAWTEGGMTILSLDEFLPLADAKTGLNVSSELTGSTPVLLPIGLEPDDPKVIHIALAQSGLTMRDLEPGRSAIVSSSGSPRQGADLRRRPVNPTRFGSRTSDTISGGGALLYGQIVEPPFRVEIAGEEIHLNGVTIYPSPGVPGPAPDTATVDLFTFTSAAHSTYRQDLAHRGGAAARLNLRETMVSHEAIASAEWLTQERLRLIKSDGTDEIMVLEWEARDPDPPSRADREAELITMAEELRQALRHDFTICAGATYLLTSPERGAESLRNRLREILASGDDDTLKLLRLRARTGHGDAAADLLYAR